MRLATLRTERGPRLAAVVEGGAVAETRPHDDLLQPELVILPAALGSLDDVVRGGPGALEAARIAAADGERVPLDPASLAAPLARFNRDILCTGWNYWDHFYESAGKREGQDPKAKPEHPTFFTKGPDTVVGPADDIAFDPALSVPMGLRGGAGAGDRPRRPLDPRGGRLGPRLRLLRRQRRLPARRPARPRRPVAEGQVDRSTMPLGPWITTIDEVPGPAALRVECEVDGQLLESASTGEMAFPMPTLIAELSRGMTLRAGDVLLTGTPSGIGNAREPQVFLADGNIIETRVSGLGTLRNG